MVLNKNQNIDNTRFERVLSIPASVTAKYAYEYPYVYECPKTDNYHINKDKVAFVTFRRGNGGEMERIFVLPEEIIVNPKKDIQESNSFIENDEYDNDTKERIMIYCYRNFGSEFPEDNKQFFVLPVKKSIKIPQPYPKPKRNNTAKTYYSLRELLSGKELIEPISSSQ